MQNSLRQGLKLHVWHLLSYSQFSTPSFSPYTLFLIRKFKILKKEDQNYFLLSHIQYCSNWSLWAHSNNAVMWSMISSSSEISFYFSTLKIATEFKSLSSFFWNHFHKLLFKLQIITLKKKAGKELLCYLLSLQPLFWSRISPYLQYFS